MPVQKSMDGWWGPVTIITVALMAAWEGGSAGLLVAAGGEVMPTSHRPQPEDMQGSMRDMPTKGPCNLLCPAGWSCCGDACVPLERVCHGMGSVGPLCCPQGKRCMQGSCRTLGIMSTPSYRMCPEDMSSCPRSTGLACCPRDTTCMDGMCVAGMMNSVGASRRAGSKTGKNAEGDEFVMQSASPPPMCPPPNVACGNGVCCPKGSWCLGDVCMAALQTGSRQRKCMRGGRRCATGRCCPRGTRCARRGRMCRVVPCPVGQHRCHSGICCPDGSMCKGSRCRVGGAK